MYDKGLRNDSDILITVGIAAFNCADQLQTCVQSVLQQVDDRTEIVIVDDGSEDETSQICADLAKENPCIRVYWQRNSGLSSVRNACIEKARGKFLIFVDADDRMLPDSIRSFSKILEEVCPDICFSDFILRKRGQPQYIKPLNCPAGSYYTEDKVKIMSCCLEGRGFSSYSTVKLAGAAWAKAYKRDFLLEHGLLFDKCLPRAQDVAFNLLAINKANAISYLAAPTYEYMVYEGSKSRRFNAELFEQMKEFSVRILPTVTSTGSASLYNDYCYCTLNQIEGIYRRGGLRGAEHSRSEVLQQVVDDPVYSRAISDAHMRSPLRIKENLKLWLYRKRAFRLQSWMFDRR